MGHDVRTSWYLRLQVPKQPGQKDIALAQWFWPLGHLAAPRDLKGWAGWWTVLLISSGVEARDAAKCSVMHRTASHGQPSSPTCRQVKNFKIEKKFMSNTRVSLSFPGNIGFEEDDTRQSDAQD